MRPTVRFLAAVQRALEPGSPTGLTGLTTHPAPRSTLIYLYSSTLSKLKQIPESSVYRQSTEALTKQRLNIVEAAKPPGYDVWADRVSFKIAKHQEALAKDGKVENLKYGDREFFFAKMGEEEVDEREVEWDGEPVEPPALEGPRTLEEQERNPAITGALRGKGGVGEEIKRERLNLEAEPMLTMEQISELETKIGAGLIEEVIQVAEGEHKLVDEMIRSKAWEDLCERPPEGQWTYFERGPKHTATQKP